MELAIYTLLNPPYSVLNRISPLLQLYINYLAVRKSVTPPPPALALAIEGISELGNTQRSSKNSPELEDIYQLWVWALLRSRCREEMQAPDIDVESWSKAGMPFSPLRVE
jgi:hypothetical protein